MLTIDERGMALLLEPPWLTRSVSAACIKAMPRAAALLVSNDDSWAVAFFHQTRAFEILSMAAVTIIIVALGILQYRRMVNTLRDRLEVRHAERERIARELHDTLLQGIQGLILHFQAVAERIPQESPLRAQIDQALDRADTVLIEGRDRVRDLRASDHGANDLSATFSSLGAGFAEEWPTKFRVVCGGEQQAIDPVIREEIYLIGREALLNAFRHAQAAAIEAELAYDVKQFRLCVRDDGIGIPPDIMEAGHRPGHWGLVGMRERANCIGGKLKILARQGTGVEVELLVPSGIAYVHARRPRWVSLKRLLSLGR
jgi:signal transduction histidine kinase